MILQIYFWRPCSLSSSYISFGVTAMRARTMSSGYVSMAAVVPASEPARSLGTGGSTLHQRRQEYEIHFCDDQKDASPHYAAKGVLDYPNFTHHDPDQVVTKHEWINA